MTNLEKLITATPGQIRGMFCENCDKCPNFIFERCDAGKNGFVEWLNEEAKTQKDSFQGSQIPRKGEKIMNRKLEIFRNCASTVISILLGLIWFWLAWEFTQKDLLEIVIVYLAFIMLPSYLLPYVIIDEIVKGEV